MVRSQRRRGERAALAREELWARLFGPASRPTKANTTRQVLSCEKCGRPLGPALLHCPYRRQETCPVRVEHPSVRTRGLYWTLLILGIAAATVGSLLAGLYLVADTGTDRSPHCLLGLCAAPLGLLAVVLGGLALFGEQLTLTDPATGQMWQRHRIGGFTTYQATASALRPLAPAPQLRRPLRIPASVCALYRDENGTHVFYMALLSLLSQGFVALQCTMTSRTVLGARVPLQSGRTFVLLPGLDPSPFPVAGDLEASIVRAVGEWSQRTDEIIRSRGGSRRRAFKHFLALEDLVYTVLGGEQAGPDYWLTHDLVGADAVRRGLGRMVGPLKARFEPLPEHRDAVLGEYGIILEVHHHFKASQPDIALELWVNIEKHIERLRPDTS